jgi:hypothetical protein
MDVYDEKLINLKIKRYLTQYEYLELELQETEYLFEQYNKQFLKEYYNVDEPAKPNIVIQTDEELDFEINVQLEGEGEDDSIDKETLAQLKKLYRLLSLKTHPDKNNGSKESKEIFATINKAYKDKDIIQLLKFALKFHIEVTSSIINKCMCLFEKSIDEMKGKIEHIKTTVAWNWGTATEEEKEQHRDTLKKANL